MASGYDIGPKIGIDGEAEFRKQIQDITTGMKTLGSEMKVVTTQFMGQEKSMESLTAQNEVLERTVFSLNEKLDLQKKMLQASANAYGEADARTQKWQQEVNATQAELNKANALIAANTERLENNGMTAAEAAKERAKAAEEAAKAEEKANKEAEKAAEEHRQKVEQVVQSLKGWAVAAAAALTAATTAVAGLVKESLGAYGEYEQLVGGVETLFGAGGQSLEEYAASQGKAVEKVEEEYNALMAAQETVLKNANDAYKTAGLSANEYMETATASAAALINSLKGDTEKAAKLTDLAITDMSDNANKMGSSMESIQNAYAGFAKGQYNMLDNLKLGYGGTKTEMERLLKDAEKLTGKKYNLDSYADIVEAIHAVQVEMGIAGTTAREASETIQGSTAAMGSAWSNLIAGMGDENADLDQLIDNLVDSVLTMLDNVVPRVEQILVGMGEAITKFAPVLAELLPEVLTDILPSITAAGAKLLVGLTTGLVSALPTLVKSIPGIITALVDAFQENWPALQEAGMELFDMFKTGVIDQIPELLDQAPKIIADFLGYIHRQLPAVLDQGVELLNKFTTGIVNAIPDLLSKLPQIIKTFVTFIAENLPKVVQAGMDILGNLITGIIDNLPELGKAAGDIIAAIGEGVLTLIGALWDIGVNIVTGIWDGIKGKAEWLAEQVGGFFGGILGGVKKLLGIHSPSTVFRDEVGYNIGLGVAQGLQNSSDKAVKAANTMAKNVYKASKDWLDKNAKYMDLSLADQLEVWETIQSQFIEGSQQWADAEEEIFDLRQKIQEEHDNAIIDSAERAVKVQSLTAAEQLAIWEKAQSELTRDSKQYQKAEEKVFALREKAQTEHDNAIISSAERAAKIQSLTAAEQLAIWENAQREVLEGSTQFQKAEEQVYKLREQVLKEFGDNATKVFNEAAQLQKSYDDALAKRTESLYGIYGLFDEAKKKEWVSGYDLIRNLQGQIDSLGGFYENVEKLTARGVSEDLVAEIRAMGPKAANELEGLLRLSDTQLAKYNKLYEEKRQLAADLAAEELAEMKAETDRQVEEHLAELAAMFDQQAPGLGESLTDGLAEGIRNGTSDVISAAIDMARAAILATKDELGIHSPSTVFAGIGSFMAEGLGVGWEKEFKQVKAGIENGLDFDAGAVSANLTVPGLTAPGGQPDMSELMAGMVNGVQTAMAGGGNEVPHSATIILPAADGTTVARWILPDLRAAMRDDPEVV